MNFDGFNIELTAEEVIFAGEIFNAAYSNKLPIPELFGSEPPEDGKSYLVLKNIPLNRANVALMDAFKDEPGKGAALGFRLMSLSDFLRDSRIKSWVKHDTDIIEFHPNIFEALAKYRITKDDEETKENFFKELEKLGK